MHIFTASLTALSFKNSLSKFINSISPLEPATPSTLYLDVSEKSSRLVEGMLTETSVSPFCWARARVLVSPIIFITAPSSLGSPPQYPSYLTTSALVLTSYPEAINGPVPTGFTAGSSSAVTSIMPVSGSQRLFLNEGTGFCVLTVSTFPSASILSIYNVSLNLAFISAVLSQHSLTLSAVSGFPFWNVTPSLRVITHVFSSAISQLSARNGCGSSSPSSLKRVSVIPHLDVYQLFQLSAGSRLVGHWVSAMTRILMSSGIS